MLAGMLPAAAKRLRTRLSEKLFRPIKSLTARLERTEQLVAREFERIRSTEAQATFLPGQSPREIAEAARALVERRYGVLSDRLRLLQQQTDIDRIRAEESLLGSLAAKQRLDAISADLATVNARLRATPFMTAPVFPRPTHAADQCVEFDYVGFEEIFRGSEDMIRERQRPYLRFIQSGARVIDLGCGRGEFLDLAREVDAHVTGIDINAAMAERCRDRGHDVRQGDALEFLRELEPATVDVIFSAQFIEHIDPPALYEMFCLSRRALRDGGTFIAETVNPHSIEAFRTFHVDLTHIKPLFPEVLAFFARSAGFGDGRIFYPNGAGFEELSPWNQGEYALVATISAASGDAQRE